MAQKRNLPVKQYWSTDKILSLTNLSKVMPRDRYLEIFNIIHFNDINAQDPNDPLIKLRPVINILKANFAGSFHPFQNLCIDESLLLYKERCYFKQYIPSKRSRFGAKSFIICDCKTGYILDFIIYTGKDTDIKTNNSMLCKSGNIVTTLMRPYLGKGHTLITDNWYTSPRLYTLLHKHKTNAYGTMRKNRVGMPQMKKKSSLENLSMNLQIIYWQCDGQTKKKCGCCRQSTVLKLLKADG
jgi:hypothetical protein